MRDKLDFGLLSWEAGWKNNFYSEGATVEWGGSRLGLDDYVKLSFEFGVKLDLNAIHRVLIQVLKNAFWAVWVNGFDFRFLNRFFYLRSLWWWVSL